MGNRAFLLPLGSGLVALLLLWGGYSAWFFMGENHRSALMPIDVPTVNWQIVEGGGHADRKQIVLARPGAYGQAMASAKLDVPVPVGSLDQIHVEFEQRGDAMERSVGIATSPSFSQFDRAPLRPDEDGRARAEAVEFFPRFDEVRYVAVSVRGALREPVLIKSVEIELGRPGFFEFQAMLARSLVNTASWTQRSINHARPNHSPLRVAPVVVVALWVGFALALTVGTSIRRRQWRRLLPGALGLLVVGWFLLDLGWQLTLAGNHVEAVERFRGESQAERRLAGPDGDVFAFIGDLKTAVDDPGRRFVIFSDFEFAHYRGRYFAVPQPVVSREGVTSGWLRRLQEGDVLAAVHLTDGLEEQGLGDIEHMAGEARHTRVWQTSKMTGQNAEVVSESGVERLRLKRGERPWLVQSGWFALDPGVWRLEIGLGATKRDGWMRLEVLRRNVKGPSQSERLAWRETFVRGSELKDAILSFRAREGEEFHFRVRELDARGSTAGRARLTPTTPAGAVVELSEDGSPPYFLARRLVRSDVGVGYELF